VEASKSTGRKTTIFECSNLPSTTIPFQKSIATLTITGDVYIGIHQHHLHHITFGRFLPDFGFRINQSQKDDIVPVCPSDETLGVSVAKRHVSHKKDFIPTEARVFEGRTSTC
jgi:hypothetical protein